MSSRKCAGSPQHNQRMLLLLGCQTMTGLMNCRRRPEANKYFKRSSGKPVVCLRQQGSHSFLEFVTEAEQSCIVYQVEEPMFLCTSHTSVYTIGAEHLSAQVHLPVIYGVVMQCTCQRIASSNPHATSVVYRGCNHISADQVSMELMQPLRQSLCLIHRGMIPELIICIVSRTEGHVMTGTSPSLKKPTGQAALKHSQVSKICAMEAWPAGRMASPPRVHDGSRDRLQHIGSARAQSH